MRGLAVLIGRGFAAGAAPVRKRLRRAVPRPPRAGTGGHAAGRRLRARSALP